MSGFIYFCACPPSRALKIGHSMNVARRVRVLDAVNPFAVELQAELPATQLQEKELHRALAKHRTKPDRRTEWYFWNKETHELLEIAQSGASASDLIAAAYEITGQERLELRRKVACLQCGNTFRPSTIEYLSGKAKFCSVKCKGAARDRIKQLQEALQ